MSEAADAAMIEAADADGRLRDDPLTDRPVDAAAAAERERSAKAAKLAAQAANAMVAVQGQLKLRGQAADKANTKQLLCFAHPSVCAQGQATDLGKKDQKSSRTRAPVQTRAAGSARTRARTIADRRSPRKKAGGRK